MNIQYAIAHAKWDPRRHEPLLRMMPLVPKTPLIVDSKEREHANVWAKRLWTLISHDETLDSKNGEPITGWVVLNDDVTLHPDFGAEVARLVEANPGRVLSLHCQFPAIKKAADEGYLQALCYWVSGPAYFLPAGAASELLAWLEKTPKEWFAGDTNEDAVLAHWLWSKQEPAIASIPALVRHDVTVPSTLGYDNHPDRMSPVDWALYPTDRQGTEPPSVETSPYIETPWLEPAQYSMMADALRGAVPLCGLCWGWPAAVTNTKRNTGVCSGCVAKIQTSVSRPVTRVPASAAPHLVIATPIRGSNVDTASVTVGYHNAMVGLFQLMAGRPADLIPAKLTFNADNIRARNRIVDFALNQFPSMKALLWWDDDNYPNDLGLIDRMLDVVGEAGIVGAPYTTKGENPRWVHAPLRDGSNVSPLGLVEVLRVGFGLTMVSRNALESVSAASRRYYDTSLQRRIANIHGQLYARALPIVEGEEPHEEDETLMSEDFSFCERWRKLGGKVWIDARPGNNVMHVGAKAFDQRDFVAVDCDG